MTLRPGHLFFATALFAATNLLGADTSSPPVDTAPLPSLTTPPPSPPVLPAAPAVAPTPTPTPTPKTTPADSAPVSSAGLKQDAYTNAVAAVVNGKIITMTELIKACRPVLDDIFKDLSTRFPPTEEGAAAAQKEFARKSNELGADMLHGMVDHALIVEEFHTRGYGFPQSYLDWQFDEDITTKFQGDHEKYLRYLQAHSMTEADYRKQLVEGDIEDAMMQQLRGTATGISPDRIKAYYEQHKQEVKESIKVRRITLNLAPVADVTPDLIMQQAAKIVQQARLPGANFAELAKQYSTDPSARSGDLPSFVYYRNDQALAPALWDAVFKLQPGQVSDPLVSDKLIFIFKCEDRTEAGFLPLEKVRARIEDELLSEDSRDAREKWLQKLREKAFIQYNVYGPVANAGK